jgi:hypothetical protein
MSTIIIESPYIITSNNIALTATANNPEGHDSTVALYVSADWDRKHHAHTFLTAKEALDLAAQLIAAANAII